ncbi:MAG: hypothetical protein A2173_07225 [Planctomycetes bacterium RBG_13_44_8b]|nr:MAG: hypothetical protein A2173_07225 [Planctomycetes bacterium RBG_13_44_8b]
MSFALTAGVTGLQAHQKMLDVAGNNLANVNTTAFKASRITFSELLSETIKKASQPTATVGGTNPQQMGSGVGVAGISPTMTQGSIENTGNPLDLAVEGEGYFVLSDGQQNVYTRAGVFAVDSESNLVDPSTGYIVQRTGREGETEGFQTPGDSNIHIPFDASMPAYATTEITVSGNLSADATFADGPQTQIISSDIAYTTDDGTVATDDIEIDQLDQFSGGSEPDGQLSVGEEGTIDITGYNPNGTEIDEEFTVEHDTTLEDLIDYLNDSVLDGATASIDNGKIRITDDSSGYSKTDIALSYSGDGSLTVPGYFEIQTIGGEEAKNISITVFDSMGGKHVLSGAFVRTDTANTWDLVLTSITGDIYQINPADRRIEDVSFNASDGSYNDLSGSDTAEFVITFEHDIDSPQTIDISMGTAGQMDGLTQFKGTSTAVAREQDGYEAGTLSVISVNNEGILIGAFSNGIKKNIATLQISLFQNPSGLESIGGGYFSSSANSGEAVATQAMTGGAGTVHGGALEKSNADVATEFVNLIQAQNGYQANARTIKVANDILRELSSLIR